jgi:hypothetical protein
MTGNVSCAKRLVQRVFCVIKGEEGTSVCQPMPDVLYYSKQNPRRNRGFFPDKVVPSPNRGVVIVP